MSSELNLDPPLSQMTSRLSDIQTDELDTHRFVPNMAAMRSDISRITSDMQGGEDLYRQTLQRIESLMVQIEKAELGVSVLSRLEPENRRLKIQLRRAQDELDQTQDKLSLITSHLEDHQERLDEKTTQHDQMRLKLIAATKRLQDYAKALKQSQHNLKQHSLSLGHNKTELTVETRENKILRQKISKLSEIASLRQNAYLESSKTAESLRLDYDEQREQTEHYRSETQELRLKLNTAKRQNNAIKGKMQALHDEIKALKTQYELNIIGREDQINDLQIQLTDMSDQLGLKKSDTDIDISSLETPEIGMEMQDTSVDIQHTHDTEGTELQAQIDELKQKLDNQDRDLISLRQDSAEQLRENQQLKNFIESQTTQLEVAEKALLDYRYDKATHELSLRDEKRQSQRTNHPDIQSARADVELALKDENVEERILQYKFGPAN